MKQILILALGLSSFATNAQVKDSIHERDVEFPNNLFDIVYLDEPGLLTL